MINLLAFNPQAQASCVAKRPDKITCGGTISWTASSFPLLGTSNAVFLGLQITNNNDSGVVCIISDRIVQPNGDGASLATPNCSSAPVLMPTKGSTVNINEYAGIQCLTTTLFSNIFGGGFDPGTVGKPQASSPLLLTCTSFSTGVSSVFKLYASSPIKDQGAWRCDPWQ